MTKRKKVIWSCPKCGALMYVGDFWWCQNKPIAFVPCSCAVVFIGDFNIKKDLG